MNGLYHDFAEYFAFMGWLYQNTTASLGTLTAFMPITYIALVDKYWLYPEIVLNLFSR
jgi:hypothetical protein